MIKYPPVKFWEYFKNTNGAMSSAEAIFMYNTCLMVKDIGNWVEMGTAYGKSAIVSLMAWIDREEHLFVMLEPNENIIKEAQENIVSFKKEFGGKIICPIVQEYSTGYLDRENGFSYIMWDTGSHGQELVSLEKPLIDKKIISGGILIMHDINSQFTACTNAYKELIFSGKYEPIEFSWKEIFDYVIENNLEEGNKSWHLYPKLNHPPNFIGAVIKK